LFLQQTKFGRSMNWICMRTDIFLISADSRRCCRTVRLCEQQGHRETVCTCMLLHIRGRRRVRIVDRKQYRLLSASNSTKQTTHRSLHTWYPPSGGQQSSLVCQVKWKPESGGVNCELHEAAKPRSGLGCAIHTALRFRCLKIQQRRDSFKGPKHNNSIPIRRDRNFLFPVTCRTFQKFIPAPTQRLSARTRNTHTM
jgi:hypothetical protein